MADTYTLIEKITVGAAGATDVTFTSIPQTYTDLNIVVSARTNRAFTVDGIVININGSASNFSGRYLEADGVSAYSGTSTTIAGSASSANATASTFGNTSIYIPNYTSSNNKSFSVDTVAENNGTVGLLDFIAGLWSNTAAITSITLKPFGGTTFSQYSTFYLYGIAKEGVSPAPSSAPYATGGDSILFDGTYWIHTFTSSGTFTPKKALTCDYLVVAGGGGGNNDSSGGGGAGGLRSTVTATGGGGSLESALSLAANTGYTVTVGAGGAYTSQGSNSVFSTITSTGGGRAGGIVTSYSGGSGGSGGGASAGNTGSVAGTGTANQGYNGGGAAFAPNYPGGGGGGAGAVGGTPASGSANGGNGGAGVAVSISGSSVTYAGGGGGNGALSAAGGTGGSGGGGTGGYSGNQAAATNGTANTGGGAGGGNSANQRSGGSGIVIVRYAA